MKLCLVRTEESFKADDSWISDDEGYLLSNGAFVNEAMCGNTYELRDEKLRHSCYEYDTTGRWSITESMCEWVMEEKEARAKYPELFL